MDSAAAWDPDCWHGADESATHDERIAVPGDVVADQTAIDRYRVSRSTSNNRVPIQATQGTAMELPIAL